MRAVLLFFFLPFSAALAADEAASVLYRADSQRQMADDQNALYADLESERLVNWSVPAEGESVGAFLKKPAEWNASAEAQRLAEIVMSFQTPAGGWSKGMDFQTRPRQPGERWSLAATGWSYVGTFDNGATTTELRFLANVSAATGRNEVRAAFERGLDYVLRAQFPNGGWPQVWPLMGGYHDALTFNDNAMVNVLRLLREVARGRGVFASVPEGARGRAAASLERGTGCLLASQVRVEGKLTAWGQQHDAQTLAPTNARAFEMVALASGESAGLLRFLMEIETPNAEVVAAVHSSAAWLRKTAIENVAWERVGKDRRLTERAGAGPLWARFYEIGTNRPLFGDRDGSIHSDVQKISSERRNGYAWYVDAPRGALEKYAKWARTQPAMP